jgi:hypothetical protein
VASDRVKEKLCALGNPPQRRQVATATHGENLTADREGGRDFGSDANFTRWRVLN